MDSQRPINNLAKILNNGAAVCIKLKLVYYPEREWKLCYREVSKIFKAIKCNLRPAFASPTEDEFIEALAEYTPEDLKEAYDLRSDPSVKK